jgi:hypothetical protein
MGVSPVNCQETTADPRDVWDYVGHRRCFSLAVMRVILNQTPESSSPHSAARRRFPKAFFAHTGRDARPAKIELRFRSRGIVLVLVVVLDLLGFCYQRRA